MDGWVGLTWPLSPRKTQQHSGYRAANSLKRLSLRLARAAFNWVFRVLGLSLGGLQGGELHDALGQVLPCDAFTVSSVKVDRKGGKGQGS